MTVRIIGGDCLVQVAKLAAAGVMVDSIVTDPPYPPDVDYSPIWQTQLRTGFCSRIL